MKGMDYLVFGIREEKQGKSYADQYHKVTFSYIIDCIKRNRGDEYDAEFNSVMVVNPGLRQAQDRSKNITGEN